MRTGNDKITLNLEYGKIGAALVMAGTFLYYAGLLKQEVADIRAELNYIRAKVDGIYVNKGTPLGNNTLFTGANRLEACLLNEEERL